MAIKRMTPDIAKNLSLAEQHEWFQQRHSRRSILKGGILGAGTLVAGPALLARTAQAVEAAGRPAQAPMLLASTTPARATGVVPFGRHITFGADPTSEMRIAWQVAGPVADPFVRIGTSPFDLGERLAAELRNVSTPLADITAVDSLPPAMTHNEEQYYLHASAAHLDPGKTYYYVVGHRGFDPTAHGLTRGLISSFTTAPRGAVPFTFTAFGDQGSTYDSVASTNLILAQSPAFHLHAGDVSYAEDGGSGLITDAYDPRVWDSFFSAVEPTAKTVPWMVSLGNHEMEAWYSPDGYGADVKRLDFPGNGPSICPGTYSFTYGNVAFISLDPNDVSYELPANFGYSGGKQTSWLGHTLRQLRNDASIDFIVVFFHHCGYCTCTAHGSEGGVRQFWAPLFDQYHVDLVINGHNHIYERTDPIRAGAPTKVAPIGATIHPANEGTTYVAAGGAGKSLYSFGVPDSYEHHVDNVASVASYVNEAGGTEVDETVTWSRVRYTGYNLMVVDVAPPTLGSTRMDVRTLNGSGVEVDRFTLERSA
jgi:hypothetical protein